MSNDRKYHGQHTVTFSQTSGAERLRKFLPYLPREIPLFATVVISFWGVAKVLSQLGGETLSLKNLAVPAFVTAFVVMVYKAIQKFRAYVPESLASESKVTRAIFRKGACGWQFALALQMLNERTESYDRTLVRVENGAYFVYPRHLDKSEYIDWIKERPEVLTRLIRAVAIQCVSEIPSILATTKDELGLSALKDSVVQLSYLYKETLDFEVQSRSTRPPELLGEVHEMTYDWSRPIRLGVQEFIGVLKSLSEISAKDLKAKTVAPPDFSITFEPPPNVDEFVKRLSLVDLSSND